MACPGGSPTPRRNSRRAFKVELPASLAVSRSLGCAATVALRVTKEVGEFKKEGAKQKAKDQAAAAKEAAKARKKGGAGHGGFRAWSSDPRG